MSKIISSVIYIALITLKKKKGARMVINIRP